MMKLIGVVVVCNLEEAGVQFPVLPIVEKCTKGFCLCNLPWLTQPLELMVK